MSQGWELIGGWPENKDRRLHCRKRLHLVLDSGQIGTSDSSVSPSQDHRIPIGKIDR
jgi:hypothetical protein